MKKKVGVKKLKTTKKSTKEEKKKRDNRKNAKGAESHEVERGHGDITNTMIGQILPNKMVPPLRHFQVPQFPVMQFQPGQPQYYHQFLVPPGLQMPLPTIIPPIRNVQSKERMDIPGTSMGTQLPQRPPSTGNPDYISPLKRETGIGQPGKPVLVSGQPGRDHSGHRQ
uniref:Uncharacterized protein n=1 Tax=Romanomermis culicivorax TaxID=13658 RepID=A0A915HG12_ROMCU